MHTRLLTAILTLALTGFGAASASAATVHSGNFHLADGTVGCHWETFFGTNSPLPTAGSIRCERYADHSMVEIDRTGHVHRVAHWSGNVKRGTVSHKAGWSGSFAGPSLSCMILKKMDPPSGRKYPVLQCIGGRGGSFDASRSGTSIRRG